MSSEDVCKQYRGRLQEKAALLEECNFATGKLKEVIESDKVEPMIWQLKTRQRIIDRIKRIDKEMDRLVKLDGFSKNRLSKNAKKEIKGYLGQIKSSLKTLGALDQACMASAKVEQESIRSGIFKLRNGIQLTRGYGRTSVKHPRFLDISR